MARFVSLLVLVAILVIISIIFFQVMAGFFVPLFLAALLGVVVQPLYRWTLLKCRGYRHLAAGITTALVALIVLLPIGLVVTTATLEGLSLIDQLQLADVRRRHGGVGPGRGHAPRVRRPAAPALRARPAERR